MCVLGCSGLKVPGDYARLVDAVAALPTAGGTICLGAQSFDEDVDIESLGPVVLQGVSASQTGVHIVDVVSSDLVVRGVQIDSLSIYEGGESTSHNLTVTASTLGSVAVGLTACEINVEGGALTATLDGVELIGLSESSPDVAISQSGRSILQLTVENSYLHDGPDGLRYSLGLDAGALTTTLVIENDTFENNGDSAIFVAGSGVEATIFNNILVNNGTGITVSGATGPSGNNAFFDNGTNYGGTWQAKATDLVSDPTLDSMDPPGLLAQSPCLGAGDPTHAPAHDFYGNLRGSHPDLGAVQSSAP